MMEEQHKAFPRDKKAEGEENKKNERHTPEENREKRERKIDEQVEQSFPASDPPSYSQPGNDGLDEE